MKRMLLDILVCPACLPEERALRLADGDVSGEEIERGRLVCSRCGASYPIESGVAEIVPGGFGSAGEPVLRYEREELLSAYLWSHFADLLWDPDASGAYGEWAREIRPVAGACLDAGCATGRFAFEMSRKCDFVVGIDRSWSFISTARRLLLSGETPFRQVEEGRLYSERCVVAPSAWDREKVEFLVADACALPFRAHFFSCISSLNLIDKVPRPLAHIREADRAARSAGSQFLLSDPFSWSEEVSPSEEWLGGVPNGAFSGRGIDNIERILRGEGGLVSSPWEIARRGAVWWKIRYHRNRFELVRSLFLKAER